MFLKLQHQNLDVYKTTRKFVLECYKITKLFPVNEKYVLTSQIRRAGLSVHLNLAEGSSRKYPVERKRFFEISRSSVIEIDAAFDITSDLGYFDNQNIEQIEDLTNRCFSMLSRLIVATN